MDIDVKEGLYDKVHDTAIVDLKRHSRRNAIFAFYLTGNYGQEQLATMFGVSRDTVWKDLKWCEENTILDLSAENVLQSALMQLKIDRMKLIEEADDIREFIAKAEEGSITPTQRAKLHETVGDLIKHASLVNIKILERFTQTTENITNTSNADERARNTISFFVERFGSGCLEGFEEYMKAADLGRRMPVTSWKMIKPGED